MKDDTASQAMIDRSIKEEIVKAGRKLTDIWSNTSRTPLAWPRAQRHFVEHLGDTIGEGSNWSLVETRLGAAL